LNEDEDFGDDIELGMSIRDEVRRMRMYERQHPRSSTTTAATSATTGGSLIPTAASQRERILSSSAFNFSPPLVPSSLVHLSEDLRQQRSTAAITARSSSTNQRGMEVKPKKTIIITGIDYYFYLK
jgi:hypothetical protein